MINSKSISGLGIVFSILLSININATDYFVSSSSGDDNNSGTSELNAWKTIAHVNKQTFQPGDNIFFKRGDTWRNETVHVNNSGNKDAYITYGAYGSGTKPRILGSLQGTSWTRHETAENIWICDNVDYVGMGGYIAQIFLAKESITQNRDSIIWGDINLSAQLSDLEYNYEWAPIGGEVYMYYEGDINADFKYVEVPKAANSIFINFQEYIAFDNLELAFTSFSGIRDAYGPRYLEGLKVTNCYIHHIGHKNSNTAYGTYTYHSDAYFAHNEIHDCGRRSISLAMVEFGDGAVMKNIVVENNYFHEGWHTTGVDIIASGNSAHVFDSIIIRKNLFEHNPEIPLYDTLLGANFGSNHIFVANQTADRIGSVQDIYVYNNIFKYARGKSCMFENIDTGFIAYNTFYGFNEHLSVTQPMISLSQDSKNITVQNNIIYNNGDPSVNVNLWALYVSEQVWTGGYPTTKIDYNLYYADHQNTVMWVCGNRSEGNGWGFAYNEFATYQNDFSKPIELNSLTSDPNFIDAPNDLSLGEGSPAIGKALPMSFIDSDYYGNPRNSLNPTIGAIEFGVKSNKTNSQLLSQEVRIIPNPINEGSFNVLLPENIEAMSFSVKTYSMSGSLVGVSDIIYGNSGKIVINECLPGCYIVKIEVKSNNGTNSYLKKVLVN